MATDFDPYYPGLIESSGDSEIPHLKVKSPASFRRRKFELSVTKTKM